MWLDVCGAVRLSSFGFSTQTSPQGRGRLVPGSSSNKAHRAGEKTSPPLHREISIAPLLVVLLCLLLAGCRPHQSLSDGVQLIPSTAEPTSTTSFELRFDQPMVQAPSTNPAVSPLLFDPPLPGKFLWTSTRGGVFSPSQPLALDTAYRIRLARGLTDADGKPAAARLRQTYATPGFGIAGWSGPGQSIDASSAPEYRLFFNANIRPEALSGRAGFLSQAGQWIPAAIRQDTAEGFYWTDTRDGSSSTWRELFDRSHPQTNAPAASSSSSDSESEAPVIPNLLVVTPRQPLPAGEGWQLIVNSGLSSADGRLQSRQTFRLPIGNVQEFTLQDATMHHVINREPYLELEFTKSVSPALTNTFTNWIRIQPWPDGVAARLSPKKLWLEGGWQRDTNYLVTLREGLPAAESFVLKQLSQLTSSVPPIDSRLYFPEFSSDQIASGNRTFPLIAVNVPRVKVRAKLLDASTLIHALRGYSGYLDSRPWLGQKSDGYLRLDYNLIPGQTVFSVITNGSTNRDEARQIPLTWDELLRGRKTGAVFLEAERSTESNDSLPVLGTQSLIQLTDLGLAWKHGNGRLRALVFSYESGLPLSNAVVRLYSEENAPLGEASTDAQGQADLPFTEDAKWLAAQSGDDLHAVPLRADNIPLWSFHLPREWRDEDDTNSLRREVIFTDRDAYRPRETVQLKAIFRDLRHDGLGIPADHTGVITCHDANSRQFFQTNFTLNALGACAIPFTLPAGPAGTCQIKLSLDNRDYYKEVHLADFQPPAFEVKVHAKEAYGPGEPLELPVTARYFFGKPLSQASLEWSLSAPAHEFSAKGFDAFSFGCCYSESSFGRGSGTVHEDGTEKLDSATNLVLHPAVAISETNPQPREVSFLAEVTDINQQTITRRVNFIRHSSDFYVGIKPPKRVLTPGQKLPIELAAVAWNGQPWGQPVAARATLRFVERQTILLQGAGRSPRYRTQSSLTNVLETDAIIQPATRSAGAEAAYTGSAIDLAAPAALGDYFLEISARDAAGRETLASIEFSVSDTGSASWEYHNAVELKMVSDKTNYNAGDTATLLLEAPFSGSAWVTVEREQVHRSFLTRVEGNAPSIRVPIESGDAPNIFVSVTLLRGAAQSPHQVREPEYRIGYRQLQVADPATHLQVSITPAQTNYLPGETVSVETRVLDASGHPAPDTEVTLYAVDDAVLSLTDYQEPNLEKVFFAPRSLGVNSAISLPFLMSEDPDKLSFQNKGYLGGGGGEDTLIERLRRKFPACAFWNAELRSDAQGKVFAQFPAPDSITRYRVIAVAQNAHNQFGTGVSRLTVSKPLMVEPALPQFACLTDRLQARALVFNQTATPAEVQVTLQLDDKARSEDGSSPVTNLSLLPNTSAPVDFPVTLTAVGEAKWIWRAKTIASPGSSNPPAFTDAVESTLKVGHLAPLLREVITARIDAKETNLLGLLNPQLLEGAGTLGIDLANTRYLDLAEAISQLLHYPYGCVEQTSSSLLPWLLLRSNATLLRLTQQDAAKVNAAVESGVTRLFTMQTSSGGLSYWPNENHAMLWGSAYATMVLNLARQTSVGVPEKEFDSLLAYLSKELANPTEDTDDIGTRCLALYALSGAGRAEPAWHTRYFEGRNLMSDEDRALLALAIATGEPKSLLAAKLLEEKLPVPARSTSFFESSERAKAIRLLAIQAIQPANSQAETLMKELLVQRKHGHWYTTQGNAWSLLAIHRQILATEGNAQPDSGAITWGEASRDFTLTTSQNLFQHAFPLEAARSARALTVKHAVAQPLFAQLTVESRLPAAGSQPQDHGFSITRRYQKVDEKNRPQPLQDLRVGDRVLVTLHITVPKAAAYVAIEDPLPAVLETVNAVFKTQETSADGSAPASPDDGRLTPWWSSFQEVRADRMLFFRDHLPAGAYRIDYVARARAAGQATAPVAKIEEMYTPDRFGLTAAQPISCAP
jgi:uncharacterized protein YfaS (alpha-2-macroglobulin family)